MNRPRVCNGLCTSIFISLLALGLAWPSISQAISFGDVVRGAREIERGVRSISEPDKKPAPKPAQPSQPKQPSQPSSSGSSGSSGASSPPPPAKAAAPAKPPSGAGSIVFSTAPIDPANPGQTATGFKAGDHIYALITAQKTWRELYKLKKSKTKAELMTFFFVDGKKTFLQYITLKTPQLIDSKALPLEIAPDVASMKSYGDPAVSLGKGKGGRRLGPEAFTHDLAKLSPGEHTIKIQIYYYGKVFAEGSFIIKGQDFGFYAKLNKEVKTAAAKTVTMPAAKMNNPATAATMRKLLAAAGWQDILKLHIVDKDWWIDRMSGGNSPVKSRHMAAAVACKDGGGYYYKVCTFHQQRTIAGWAPLELTHQSARKALPKAP